MPKSAARIAVVLACVTLLGVTLVPAQGTRKAPRRREAPPPSFSVEERQLFFADVAAKLGSGGPPLAKEETTTTGSGSTPVANSDAPAAQPVVAAEGKGNWERWIRPESLQDEITAQVAALGAAVKTPTAFKSGGFRAARVSLSVLATLFSVVAEYPGEVRFKEQAAALVPAISRAGFNCKVGSDPAYREARLRWEDLSELVRGGRVEAPAGITAGDWENVADRAPLMTRMEQSLRERFGEGSANRDALEQEQEKLLVEAEVLAVLAQVIQSPRYEFAEEASYQRMAGELQQAAEDLAEAIRAKNVDQVQTSLRQVNKACDTCHGDFRS